MDKPSTDTQKIAHYTNTLYKTQNKDFTLKKKLMIVIIVTLFNLVWCEYGYYYYKYLVFCGWPVVGNHSHQSPGEEAKIMVLTDVHIMGKRKSIWVDKKIREHQMKQSFSISTRLFEPDIFVFLGDIIDEGSYSKDEDYDQYVDDFKRIFHIDKTKHEAIFVPGNHDIGFHDTMKDFPYLLYRYIDRFNSTYSIMLVTSKKKPSVKFIVLNSMSFGNDSCELCTQSLIELNHLSKQLDYVKQKTPALYSRPILLTHFPLYRHDDTNCDYPHSLANTVKKINRQAMDVVPKAKTQYILKKLNPQLVLSGHTHMNCRTMHQKEDQPIVQIPEITVSSYNHKYAENMPYFLLLSSRGSQHSINECGHPDERIIYLLYIVNIISVLVIMFIKRVKN